MIVKIMQLYCDSCRVHDEPTYDAAIFTPAEMRSHAKRAGWRRKTLDSGILRDLCPACAKKAGGR
ncbi:hypothetical protein H7849_11785 [Alloacidobacterium dinghuense]|uniref:Uncharacterized protein n=1 Tax=Alloacidobacterium dinghuense TaxID=2763107 RepID=A0A7G8BPN6_9BACT|nr:hypothetical protein [Alloacidobacterium dinghuense]QNI34506.1 hypothetical protein H7849_11785 [Alloacidobacterium dinghuense]